MKNKLLAFPMVLSLLITILSMAVPIIPTSASPAEIHVPTDYSTIQAAVGNASSGDTIIVAAGTYAGAIVDKNVTISGASGGASIITSGVPYKVGSSLYTAFGLDATAGGAEIRNFAINCNSSEGFYFAIFSRSADNVIVDSLAVNDAVQGITNYGGSNWQITNNVLNDTEAAGGGGIAIYLGVYPPGYPICSGNLIQNNTITATATAPDYTCPGIGLGVDLRWGAYDDLTGNEGMSNNRILNNSITAPGALNGVGIEMGVIGLEGNTTKIAAVLGTIHDNTIRDNTIDGADMGMYFYTVTNLTIQQNEIKNCNEGIHIKDGSDGNTINYNNIVGNVIGLNMCARAQVYNNFIEGGRVGIWLGTGPYSISTTVKGNTITDFVKAGIVTRGVKDIFIEGNTISTTLHDEAPNGIDIGTYSGTNGTVKENEISGCSWKDFTGDYETSWSGSGILVIESGDSLEITRNIVHDCDVGMDIESDSMNITRNEAYSNIYGFVFWNVKPKVNYNNIYNNTQYGVYRTYDLTGVLNAECNWWGDSSGPSGVGSGTGDAISDNVTYCPWLGYPFGTTPMTYHVNPTGTVQEAIDAASSGDTIVVHAGTYVENVNVNKAVTLKAASRPVIDGNQTGPCVTIAADSVTVDGFELTNGTFGVASWGTDNSVISNNVIHDNLNVPGYAGIGIMFWSDSDDFDNNTIEDNEIYNNDRQGIYIGGTTESYISEGNTISGNTIYNNGLNTTGMGPDASMYGIQLSFADDNTIVGNEIYGHDDWFPYGTDFDFAQGIYLFDSNDNVITNNYLHNNNYGVGLWYYSRAVENNYINYNNIAGNTGYGVRTFDGPPAVEARFNWWGNATGPHHPTTNPSGIGDAVSDYVDYIPWLKQPYPPAVSVSSLLCVDPMRIEHWTPAYGELFKVNVTVTNVTDLYAYEFKLYWNVTQLDLVNVYMVLLWEPYFIAMNETRKDLGRFWFAVTAQSPASTFNGDSILATLTFKIVYDPIYPENVTSALDLSDTVLGDPEGNSIYHAVYDGWFSCYSTKPKLEVQPFMYVAKKFGDTFTVNVTVSDVVNLYSFEFELRYNTTLLDAIEVEIATFIKEPYRVPKKIIDDTQGIIVVRVELDYPAPPANGTGILARITLRVTYAVIWPEGPIESVLSFGFTQLVTNKGVIIPHDLVQGLYRYQPLKGDLSKDGTVNLDDLMIAARAFGSKPGDAHWNPYADLNDDNIINILDLIPIASNYGGGNDP